MPQGTQTQHVTVASVSAARKAAGAHGSVYFIWGYWVYIGIMENKMETTIMGYVRVILGFCRVPNITPTMENQMEKKMENEMEAWDYTGVICVNKWHQWRCVARVMLSRVSRGHCG